MYYNRWNVLANTLLLGVTFASIAGQQSAIAQESPGGETKPPLAVDIDFPSGSAQILEIDSRQRLVRLVPTPHKDRGWACWWYCRITGIVPGETITLDVGEAPWATPDRAAFSLDNRSWSQTAAGEREGKRIVYRQQIDAREAWFAWGPPFTSADAQQLLDEAAAACPEARVYVLCRTRGDRDVPALTIERQSDDGTPRRGVWIQARQHAWESGSSWVCHGLTTWLVSDDPRAASLRRQAVIHIVPIMDVDNVAIGAGGKNQVPHDHNRDWSDQPHWHSVRAAKERITAMDQAGRLDVFVDLHNPSASARNPYFYIPPRDLLSEQGRRNLDAFLSVARQEMTGPLSFRGHIEESGPRYDKLWERISKNWVSQNTAGHVVAVTLETAWNTPDSTIEGYRTVGRQLGLAIECYLRETPRSTDQTRPAAADRQSAG